MTSRTWRERKADRALRHPGKRCKVCGDLPGPLPSDSLAALNAARVRSLVLRVVVGTHLYVRPIRDRVCTPCDNRFRRAAIIVAMEVRA